MDVDEIQCKYTRISTTNGKLGHSRKMDDQYPDDDEEGENKRILPHGAGIARFYGWPSSRIVRVSRASGGKDRHSKVLTSKGLRDRRVRLSVNTAIQFYDLQDRLGYDQPSKAVEWLLKKAETSIAELPPMNTPFPETPKQVCDDKRSSTAGSDQLGFDSAEPDLDGGDPNYSQQLTKSSACSSTSETSKGSGLSLSRSESRIKARERAKERVAEKEKEKEKERENDSSGHVASLNPISQTTSFTELLSGGINTTTSPPNAATTTTNESNFFLKSPRQWSTTPMDYFAPVTLAPPSTRSANPFTPPLFTAEHHHPELQQLSFAPEQHLVTGNSSGEYNLNFSISPCANSSGQLVGYNRGTLQSNSSSSLLPHIQRFSDGSAPSFFIGATTTAPDHQFLSGYDSRLQLCYGDPHARHSGHKGKGKN